MRRELASPATITNRKKRWRLSPETSPFFYLLPVVVFMLVMVAYPIGRIVYLSFTPNELNVQIVESVVATRMIGFITGKIIRRNW